MKIIRRPEDNVGFQLAPMIDMTFLLLIFFMVTTKISKEQIKQEIKLPVASNAVILISTGIACSFHWDRNECPLLLRFDLHVGFGGVSAPLADLSDLYHKTFAATFA